jgi:hypothetical protein
VSAAWIVVIGCLWVVGCVLAITVAGVLRRLATVLEAQAQAPASPPTDQRIGPNKGSPLPQLRVQRIDGRSMTLSELSGPFALAVLSSHCGPCLLISDWLRSHSDRLDGLALMVLTDVSGREVLGLPAEVEVLADERDEMFQVLNLPGTPFVISIDASGLVVSASLLGGPEHLLDVAGAALMGRPSEPQVGSLIALEHGVSG